MSRYTQSWSSFRSRLTWTKMRLSVPWIQKKTWTGSTLKISKHFSRISMFAPGLVMGIIQLITATNEPLAGKTALIIAKSKEFTETLSHSLAPFEMRAEPILPDSPGLAAKTQAADIVVTA